MVGMKGAPCKVMDVSHAISLVFKTLIKLLPAPEPLDELNHCSTWWQEYRVCEVAGMRLHRVHASLATQMLEPSTASFVRYEVRMCLRHV